MKITDEIAVELKKDFPIFKRKINDNSLVYLDNAATSQKPKQVLESMNDYYLTNNANIHRGIYQLSEESTKIYEDSKKVVAKFINASPEEIIYTRSATESLNLVAYSLEQYLKQTAHLDGNIVITKMEHHSNLVPWQQLAQRLGMRLLVIDLTADFTLDMDDAKRKITDETAILAVTHISNALGTVNPINELIKIAKEKHAITVIDAAQSAPHKKLDVKKLDCDFLALSSHKMFGPMGMGVLYGKKDILNKIPPFNFGGDMIKDVKFEKTEWNDVPMKFEAGTPNVAGSVGLSSAIKYIEKIGLDNISRWELELAEYTVSKLEKIDGVKIYRTKRGESSGIVSFSIDGVHHHDIASYLNDYGICIRVGHHCAMPLMNHLGVTGTARVSYYVYNTHNDVDEFIKALQGALKLFKK